MIRALVVVLLACLACSKSKGKKDEGAGTAGATVAGSAAPDATIDAPPVAKDAPCPEGNDLETRAAEVLGVKPDAFDHVECVVARLPMHAWVIAARHRVVPASPDDESTNDSIVVVEPSDRVIAKASEEVPPGAVDSSGAGNYQAADLDGDGIDELLSIYESDKRGYLIKILVVQQFVDHKWLPMFDRQFEYDNSAADEGNIVSCDATFAIEDPVDGKRAIVFEPQTKPKKKSNACIMTKERWVIGANGKFAQR